MKAAVLTTPGSHRRMDEAIQAALAMSMAQPINRMVSRVRDVVSLSVDDWAKEQLRAVQPEHRSPAR